MEKIKELKKTRKVTLIEKFRDRKNDGKRMKYNDRWAIRSKKILLLELLPGVTTRVGRVTSFQVEIFNPIARSHSPAAPKKPHDLWAISE